MNRSDCIVNNAPSPQRYSVLSRALVQSAVKQSKQRCSRGEMMVAIANPPYSHIKQLQCPLLCFNLIDHHGYSSSTDSHHTATAFQQIALSLHSRSHIAPIIASNIKVTNASGELGMVCNSMHSSPKQVKFSKIPTQVIAKNDLIDTRPSRSSLYN